MDVLVWLRSLGLGKYEATFRENEIDETVLPSLTDGHLKELALRARVLCGAARCHRCSRTATRAADGSSLTLYRIDRPKPTSRRSRRRGQ